MLDYRCHLDIGGNSPVSRSLHGSSASDRGTPQRTPTTSTVDDENPVETEIWKRFGDEID